jgi:predicted transposase/invertase (TIGR01784 family)
MEQALRAYEMREMALSDWTTAVNHARREGMSEGIKEGMKEGMMEAARKALAEGFTIEAVGKITGLDEGTIKAL